MNKIEDEWEHQYISTNKIRLHCVTQGEGELVILLHGFPEFWYAWRYQIPILARYFKVVVPDLRGYNDSDKPETGYDLDTLTADIRGLISSFGYQKARIVGHNWGGAIAWNLAQKYPHLIEKIAVLNAPHPYRFWQEITGNFDQIMRSWYMLAFQLPGLPELLIKQNLPEFVSNVFRSQAIRKAAFSAEDTNNYQIALSKPGVINAAIKYYQQIISPQTWLKNIWRSPYPITVPTLMLWSEQDSFLSSQLTKNMEKLILAPFQLKLIPECGHWMQQEVPQIVNKELLNFLRSVL
ncbi:MAG TPA: alpha/beta hydrolase [Allocoleopsis sp.]